MTTWASGYLTDIGYTYGYYAELNPHGTRLALLNAGFEPTKIRNACELGFGQGISVNIHAAADSTTAWYGTDFNPAQASFAQSLQEVSSAKANLSDESFAEFCAREDLPQFDYIALHGIWSWISDENRQIIVDFVRRKLAVGGILYISYNTLPGWSAAAPLRHLMSQFADGMTGEGQGILARVGAALDFTQQLIDTKPLYTLANTQVAERFAKIKAQNKSYLAHEYFNRYWQPMYFADMARWLEPAKVGFAGSANMLEHVDPINFSQEQEQLLAGITDPDFKQTVRDYVVNQQFRRDYWIKGGRKLDALRRTELLRAERVVLVTPITDVPLKVQGARGEAELSGAIYTPLLNVLSDHKIHTVGALEAQLQEKGINLAQLLQALLVLVGMRHVYLAQDEMTIKSSLKGCQKLNLEFMTLSRATNDLSYLASPVTGGGFMVGRFQQLFLLAMLQGKKTPHEWAQSVWQLLSLQGQAIAKEGKALSTPEENIAELTAQATIFAEKQLPILKALQIV